MTEFITIIDTLIAGALGDLTALVASDLGRILMYGIAMYFLGKLIKAAMGMASNSRNTKTF